MEAPEGVHSHPRKRQTEKMDGNSELNNADRLAPLFKETLRICSNDSSSSSQSRVATPSGHVAEKVSTEEKDEHSPLTTTSNSGNSHLEKKPGLGEGRRKLRSSRKLKRKAVPVGDASVRDIVSK